MRVGRRPTARAGGAARRGARLDDGRVLVQRVKVVVEHRLADHVQRQLREARLHIDGLSCGTERSTAVRAVGQEARHALRGPSACTAGQRRQGRRASHSAASERRGSSNCLATLGVEAGRVARPHERVPCQLCQPGLREVRPRYARAPRRRRAQRRQCRRGGRAMRGSKVSRTRGRRGIQLCVQVQRRLSKHAVQHHLQVAPAREDAVPMGGGETGATRSWEHPSSRVAAEGRVGAGSWRWVARARQSARC